ncbi:hypothetical protein VTJ49DRAFT_5016 [Mycothermus thermophilus]|uniref:Uncharacterized protein n=1 Tax=Humicola insolens TaxID=85995 RepID=A0ABR3VL90_HUMIN
MPEVHRRWPSMDWIGSVSGRFGDICHASRTDHLRQGAKAAQKRARNQQKNAPKAGSQLKSNAAAMTIICNVCKQTFLSTSREPVYASYLAPLQHRTTAMSFSPEMDDSIGSCLVVDNLHPSYTLTGSLSTPSTSTTRPFRSASPTSSLPPPRNELRDCITR